MMLFSIRAYANDVIDLGCIPTTHILFLLLLSCIRIVRLCISYYCFLHIFNRNGINFCYDFVTLLCTSSFWCFWGFKNLYTPALSMSIVSIFRNRIENTYMSDVALKMLYLVYSYCLFDRSR